MGTFQQSLRGPFSVEDPGSWCSSDKAQISLIPLLSFNPLCPSCYCHIPRSYLAVSIIAMSCLPQVSLLFSWSIFPFAQAPHPREWWGWGVSHRGLRALQPPCSPDACFSYADFSPWAVVLGLLPLLDSEPLCASLLTEHFCCAAFPVRAPGAE